MCHRLQFTNEEPEAEQVTNFPIIMWAAIELENQPGYRTHCPYTSDHVSSLLSLRSPCLPQDRHRSSLIQLLRNPLLPYFYTIWWTPQIHQVLSPAKTLMFLVALHKTVFPTLVWAPMPLSPLSYEEMAAQVPRGTQGPPYDCLIFLPTCSF